MNYRENEEMIRGNRLVLAAYLGLELTELSLSW